MDTSVIQVIVHYGGHFLLPGLLAHMLFKTQWKKAWIIMICTMVIDLDHLVATPIFLADRCSINFHPLHSYWAIGIYIALLWHKKTRVIGVGLVLHMIIDGIDCLFMS